jgi:2-polyprenyl-3-methyl-5-hydroxy-6-metoxy-1,4-benzoquinol methylase
MKVVLELVFTPTSSLITPRGRAMIDEGGTGTVMICVLCRSDRHAPVLAGAGFDDPAEIFQLVRCQECGLVSVAPLLSPEALGRYYALSYYGGSSAEKFSKPAEVLVRLFNRARASALLRTLGPHDPRATRVLDVGCGRGVFLKHLHERGYVCTGVDIPSFPLPPSRPGLTFLQSTLDDAPLTPGSMDAISIWHVLEHTADPARTIRRIAELLRPGGAVAIAVPNYGSFQSALFGKHWFHLDLPRHLYHLDRAVIERMLRDNGCEVLSVSTQSIEQNYFGFIQSALNVLFASRPNRLYALLKRQISGQGSFTFDLLQRVLGAALFPLSVLENAISVSQGRGATLIMYARKVGARPPAAGRSPTETPASPGPSA